MENIPYKWQQADGNKSFVFALNEKLTNEFCFFVQACKKGRAEEVATLACAAPALLDALESLVGCHAMHENYDVKIYATKDQMAKAKSAIKLARGEA